MIQRQLLKKRRQLPLAVLSQEPVGGRQVLRLRAAAPVQIDIEHQRFEQISLAVVPEMVALALPGVGDDDIGQHLRQQSIAVQV